jgi:acyl-CoA synthetase (AMP-forming)/AMP-acid ligase II
MTAEPTFAGDEVPRLERLSDYLDLHAARCPTREAAVSSSVRLDYRSLAWRVERCARALIAVGIERGDRVAVLSTSRPEYLVIFLAVARIGALWVGLNPRHRPREHRFVLEDARPRLVIAMSGFEDRDFTEELPALLTATPSVRRLVPLESLDLFCAEGDAVRDSAMTARMGLVGPADPLCIVYTSGSTGTPKGAMLTHRAFVASYTTQAQHWPSLALRIVNNLPVNHIGALGDLGAYCLIAGGTQVLMERFDPHALVETMRQEQVSVLYQMVAQYQRLAAAPSFTEGSFPALDLAIWGDGPIPLDLLRLLRTKARHLATSYGLSEACGPLTYSAPDASDHELSETVGKPAPEYELRLATDGRESAPGEIGEIQVRGEVVMAGYFDRPDATAKTIDREGWLHTGDLAVLRTDGNLALVGRCSEMFTSGGYNIYPREIELVLQSHPGVAFAAVVPVSDPIYQTVGHAFLLRRRGADLDSGAIALWCRSELANYKVPKRFIVVDDFPMLPNGKIDKQALRQAADKETPAM